MTMSFTVNSSNLLYRTTVILTVLHLLNSPASCVDPQRPPSVSLEVKGLITEEKTRLGSTPPTCHNKCNECHPCIAVQVPTLPERNRYPPSFGRTNPMGYLESSPSAGGRKFANYKPLCWKCRCGSRLFNP
uniref:Epidermal patterning factor-like protein n=1 Tax=Nelumbo nucifera TaxID=4432 RepID=A0A822Z928_NELNU|nr:TPA_asm: hypothetical protein HUJ06_015413 [Nelumbo nucifera]